jgi:hypothetical protein
MQDCVYLASCVEVCLLIIVTQCSHELSHCTEQKRMLMLVRSQSQLRHIIVTWSFHVHEMIRSIVGIYNDKTFN